MHTLTTAASIFFLSFPKRNLMRKPLCFLPALLLLASCGDSGEQSDAGLTHKDFTDYKEGFMERYWELYPVHASSVGYHTFDSILPVPDDAYRKKERAFAEKELQAIQAFLKNGLQPANLTDARMLENSLKAKVWELDKYRPFEWNPSEYNVSGPFAEMLNNDYDRLDTRLRNFSLRLRNVPAFYAAARQNIVHPTKEHTQLAIDQNLGGLSVFTADLPAKLKESGLSQVEKDSLNARAQRATAAITAYAEWLKALDNPNPRSFRLGKELYAEKFAFDIQSSYTPQTIYAKALNHKKELHRQMAEIAHTIWSKHMGAQARPKDELAMIRQLIDKLSVNHVKPADFQAAIERQIPELEQFVNDKKLLYLDPKKPLVVRREPDYMAGVAGASISAPGPYDKNGNTYYNVGSLSGWEPEQAESYLREYNDYILRILNIHEAVPGHYTQLVYSNQSPSIVKSIFGNGAMIEGWAVYTERMMLESGYGDNAPELWLMYYKWNLRTTCNTILDYSVHNLGMTQEQALDLLVDQGFQQQAEAEGKWKRATLTQVQLCSYFTGFSEIMDLRDEVKRKQGKQFQLKQFHEQFLSYGSAPVMYIRELMLGAH